MDKKSKALMVCIVIIALLVGYILGGNGNSKSYADVAGGDVAVLTQMFTQDRIKYEADKIFQAFIQDKFNQFYNKQIAQNEAQIKSILASIGNENLLKLGADPDKINRLTEGDWYKILKSKLSDIIPGAIGKITIKETDGNQQQKKEWTATIDTFSGTKNNDAGVLNESHRIALIGSVLDWAYEDVVKTYDIPVVVGGKLNYNKSQLETGSLTKFINNRKDLLRRYEEGLKMYGDNAPLQVQLQMLNQLCLYQSSIMLKLLETQAAANKIATLKDYVEFSENLKLKNRKQY